MALLARTGYEARLKGRFLVIAVAEANGHNIDRLPANSFRSAQTWNRL
jgi:hypothetical protein